MIDLMNDPGFLKRMENAVESTPKESTYNWGPVILGAFVVGLSAYGIYMLYKAEADVIIQIRRTKKEQ